MHPGTKQPIGPADLAPLFATELLRQEMSQERWIEIPDDVRNVLAIWRPTPLVRATNLERALHTPARIYFKDESHSPPGSHKTNTAVPQAYYNKIQGHQPPDDRDRGRPVGQRAGLRLQAVRHRLQGVHGQGQLSAEAVSPLDDADVGRRSDAQPLDGNPRRPSNSGRRSAYSRQPGHRHQRGGRGRRAGDDTKYTLGSVLNHVMLHQTVIGLEVERQMREFGDFPNVMVAAAGGGSNFAGLTFPFIRHKLDGKDIRFVAASRAPARR